MEKEKLEQLVEKYKSVDSQISDKSVSYKVKGSLYAARSFLKKKITSIEGYEELIAFDPVIRNKKPKNKKPQASGDFPLMELMTELVKLEEKMKKIKQHLNEVKKLLI